MLEWTKLKLPLHKFDFFSVLWAALRSIPMWFLKCFGCLQYLLHHSHQENQEMWQQLSKTIFLEGFSITFKDKRIRVDI